MHPINNQTSKRTKLSGSVVVGKDILELLSSAMYTDPLAIYREYIQNAADSIDEAEALGLYGKSENPKIDITINRLDRSIRIRDNGTGVSQSHFSKVLTAIGASHKRGTRARGFRGVGRLAGLGYCQELVMRSKAKDETEVMTMRWDCVRLKELLRQPEDPGLEAILSEAVTITTDPTTARGHFFEVELLNPVRRKNDILINEAVIEDYLAQIGPVPFDPSFSWASEIQNHLEKHGLGKAYTIAINDKVVYRPYKHTFQIKAKVDTRLGELECFEIAGIGSGVDAVGWILHSDYIGAIPDHVGIKGIRLRVGNIQIGDSRLVDTIFPEPRFNAWAVGECHIISNKLIPNARRDDFEQNKPYDNLINQLTPHARAIAKRCRDCSKARAGSKKTHVVEQPTSDKPVNWQRAKTFFSKNAGRSLSTNHKSRLAKVLSNGSLTYSALMHLILEQKR
jgi:hypothetical protein